MKTFKSLANDEKPKTQKTYAGFYFQGKRCMFTIPGFVCSNLLWDALRNLSPKNECEVKIFHEIGKSEYKHTHCVCLFPTRVKLASKKRWAEFAATVGSFDLKKISTDEHFQNCLNYSDSKKKKQGESTVVLDTIGEWVPDVPFHDQVCSFISSCKKWSEVLFSKDYGEYISGKLNWAHEVYNASRYVLDYKWPNGDTPLRWQAKAVDFFSEPCKDDRSIPWITDLKGNNGKSQLANYLLSHNDAFLCDGGRMQDIAYAYDNQPLVIFDLTRASKEYAPYRAMEAFKNGRIFSPKYKSLLKSFLPPHVLVLANWGPDRGPDVMSEDRFDEYFLNNFALDRELIARKSLGVPSSVKAPLEKARNRAGKRSRKRRRKRRKSKTNRSARHQPVYPIFDAPVDASQTVQSKTKER